LKIVTDEIELRKPCEPVKLFEISNIVKQFPSIAETMIKNGGCGLCSVQVGIHKTFFIAQINNTVKLFINPDIVYYSEDTNIDTEGCLSVPGVNVDIERSSKITIKYFDFRKKKVIKEDYSGFSTRIIQHEYDHLQGIICVLDKGIRESTAV
jgi:peptide deformylase